MGQKKAESLHAVALELLSRRALSAAELAARLLQRGFAQGQVMRELERLENAGLLADVELARMLVRRELESGHGTLAVRHVLRRRQVKPEAGQVALAEVTQEAQERALGRALAKALARFRDAPASQLRGKVVRYLATRGFPLALCWRATENLGGELDVNEVGEPEDTDDLS